MACVRRGGGGGADGIAAVSNCWKQISSKVICYSDRAGNIFSQSERTNNQAGKTNGRQQGKWGKEKARKQRKKEWVSERESNGGVKSEGKPKPPGCCWLATLVFRAVYLHCITHAHSHNHTYLMVICTHTRVHAHTHMDLNMCNCF